MTCSLPFLRFQINFQQLFEIPARATIQNIDLFFPLSLFVWTNQIGNMVAIYPHQRGGFQGSAGRAITAQERRAESTGSGTAGQIRPCKRLSNAGYPTNGTVHSAVDSELASGAEGVVFDLMFDTEPSFSGTSIKFPLGVCSP